MIATLKTFGMIAEAMSAAEAVVACVSIMIIPATLVLLVYLNRR